MDRLIKKQKKLSEKLQGCNNMIKGSISSVCSTCHRAKCICKTKSGKIVYRLTYKEKNQLSKIVYVLADKVPEMKKRIASFKNAKKIIDELVSVNIEIFKKSQEQSSEKKK